MHLPWVIALFMFTNTCINLFGFLSSDCWPIRIVCRSRAQLLAVWLKFGVKHVKTTRVNLKCLFIWLVIVATSEAVFQHIFIEPINWQVIMCINMTAVRQWVISVSSSSLVVKHPALGANGHRFEPCKRSKTFQGLISRLTTSWVADHVKWCLNGI